jgi:bifunctional non-homologous end joining protein LigD
VQRLSFIQPAQPILVKEPPTGPVWIHEIKWDGWRCQIIKDFDGIRVFTRKANDWTDELPTIVKAAQALKAKRFIIDGELIASTEGQDFNTIPAAVRRRQVTFIAFDLMHLNATDMRRSRLEDRKEVLAGLINDSDAIQLSEMFNDPHELLKAAEAYGLEGIVSKRKDMPYRSGRCPHWLKVKTAAWKEANAGRYERFSRAKSG